MNNKMLVVVVPPGKRAFKRYIDGSKQLNSLQDIVGGCIEIVPFVWFSRIMKLFKDIDIIVNEEGRLENLPPNIKLMNGEILVGTVVLAARKGCDNISLTVEQADTLVSLFNATRATREKEKAADANDTSDFTKRMN